MATTKSSTRKKKASSGSIVDQVRDALESHIPADWRKQFDRQYKDLRTQFDKQFSATEKNLVALRKQVDTRLNRVADRGELDKLTKRIEGLQKEIEKLARQATGGRSRSASRSSGAARSSSASRSRSATAKRAASTAKKTASSASSGTRSAAASTRRSASGASRRTTRAARSTTAGGARRATSAAQKVEKAAEPSPSSDSGSSS